MGYLINASAQRRAVLELYDLYAAKRQHEHRLSDTSRDLWDKLLVANSKANVSFAECLRLRYPRATATDIELMYQFVAPREKQVKRAEWARTMSEVQKLFGILDSNGDGGVDLVEFLSACKGVPGLPKDGELRQLFRAKDVDGNGILDYEEFSALVESAELKHAFPTIIERKKEELSGKWMMGARGLASAALR